MVVVGTTSFSQSHIITTCGSCGVQFTVPEFLHDTRAKNGANVWCPNGHQLTIPQDDEVVRLKRELSTVRSDLEAATRRLGNCVATNQAQVNMIEIEKRSANALRGANTKLKRKLTKIKELLKNAEDKVFKQVKDGLQK